MLKFYGRHLRILKGISVIKMKKWISFYTTGNPFSTYLYRCIFKLILSKPLIADFRDPWVTVNIEKGKVNLEKKIEGI